MKNKRFWLGILVITLVFGMMVVGCESGEESDETSDPTFHSTFNGTWKRDGEYTNTLTFTSTTIKASNQDYTWELQGISGNAYTYKNGNTVSTITIELKDGNLEISGDSGTGENNWNGIWKKYFTFPSTFNGTWKRDEYDTKLTFTSTILTVKLSYLDFNYIYELQGISGNSYTFKDDENTVEFTITIELKDGNLEISGDSGTGESNLSGTWKQQ